MDFTKNKYMKSYLGTLGVISEDIEINDEVTKVSEPVQEPIKDVQSPADATNTEVINIDEQQVCFKTTDPALVEALLNFEEVTFFVKSKTEEGEENIKEVKFSSDVLFDLSIEIVEQEQITKEQITEEDEDDEIDDEIDDELLA